MLQKTFEITSRQQFDEVMELLREKLDLLKPKSVAALINASRFEDEEAKELVREFKQRLPEIRLAGITTLGLESDPNRKKFNLTVFFMEKTAVTVFAVEHRGLTEEEVAERIREKLASLENIRACAFYPCGYSMNYARVLDIISAGENSDIVFFWLDRNCLFKG